MIGRRRFLQALGIGTVAAPAAAKQALDAMSADLAGVSTKAIGLGNPMPPPHSDGPGGALQAFDTRAALRKLLDNEAMRDEYTSIMFARNRHVGWLDLDLANKRSFSLAAKVTFQRQRNVAREIADEAAETPLWRRPTELLRKATGWPFG